MQLLAGWGTEGKHLCLHCFASDRESEADVLWGKWCVLARGSSTVCKSGLGEQRNSGALQHWRNTKLRIIIVFIYLLKITCNVGTQNWVSRGRMVMWATGGRVVMFSCCMAQVLCCWAASGSLSKPCHWCADLLEERKLSGRPHPQLPLFAVKCFWWEKINISAEAFSVSLR